MKRFSSSGFTLLETLIVAFMIGVLVAFAIPSWIGFVQHQQARFINDRVEWHLRLMVSEATHRKQYLRTVFCATHTQLRISDPYSKGFSPTQFSTYDNAYVVIRSPYPYNDTNQRPDETCAFLQFSWAPSDGSTLSSLCIYESSQSRMASYRTGVKTLIGAIGQMERAECKRD